MSFKSAKFIKGIVAHNEILDDGKPQVALIGRSNVGKSSIINALTNQKALARTSAFPGHTQQINLFLINKSFYLVDLPGYGFARISGKGLEKLTNLINWYLFDSNVQQKLIVLIIDAKVGPTAYDLEMLKCLEEHQKKIIIVANKIDKLKNSEYKNQIKKIQDLIGSHQIIPCSAAKNKGINDLIREIAGR